MTRYVLEFPEIDPGRLSLVGGKGAHLAELSRLHDVRVPPGFVVTTDAFRRILAAEPALDDLLDRLTSARPDDRDAVRSLAQQIRNIIEAKAIPDDLATEITSHLPGGPCAVRSSATAEDLPTASFAGQQDTWLCVVGAEAVLAHVRRCWASLFTERAVAYRRKNEFDDRKILMAVVVQEMVDAAASGVLFTADPMTSNRKITSVEATYGLGEALVSGRVNPDVYQVRDGAIVARSIGTKKLAILPSAGGGTREEAIPPARQREPALTDAQVLRLEQLGRRIEAHFGRPQDIEWCLAHGEFHIVQSRPVTTLFPIPPTTDGENHVYISVGHQQMMTDAMKPLGLSFWQLTTPRPMAEAGGRLFVDVTRALGAPTTRAAMVEGFSRRSDPLIGDALRTVVERGFVRAIPDEAPVGAVASMGGAKSEHAPSPIETDPSIVTGLVARSEASIAALKRDIVGKSGPELFDFILTDLQELKRVQFDPQGVRAILAGMEAAWWLNDKLEEWLGEKNAADKLAQSVPDNVTSEMGLALLDVADAIRPHAEVLAFLRQVDDDAFLEALPSVEGGREARDAILAWLDRYGMRCAGEIDITRPRWSERPSTLVPLILGNVAHFAPGAGKRRFDQGLEEAEAKAREVLERLRVLPDGAQKADATRRMIDRVRTFAGYREYPKYGMVSRYFVYKGALLEEADRLVGAGVLRDREDIFYLRFQELHDVARGERVDEALVRRRREEFASYLPLTPPRVLTSEGECLSGAYRRDDVPKGALVGLGVSGGTIEGRARVVHDLAQADLAPGDILVTRYTDPSWTPSFVAIAGLVTEVGGLMTHGAVIAREYGLPAVVGVEDATRRIADGQRIRVNGTEGWVVGLQPALAR